MACPNENIGLYCLVVHNTGNVFSFYVLRDFAFSDFLDMYDLKPN